MYWNFVSDFHVNLGCLLACLRRFIKNDYIHRNKLLFVGSFSYMHLSPGHVTQIWKLYVWASSGKNRWFLVGMFSYVRLSRRHVSQEWKLFVWASSRQNKRSCFNSQKWQQKSVYLHKLFTWICGFAAVLCVHGCQSWRLPLLARMGQGLHRLLR